MKQILHIFSKDVRRLRIEILLLVAGSALFAWVVPKGWQREALYGINPFQGITRVVYLALPLSWCLIIGRLIHGEVLVGDRQFWLTKPYEWPKLLAAKAIFIALFVYLPFGLMESSILIQAGFNPLSYTPGLLYQLLLISVIFLPLIALAAVTSKLSHMAFAILGVLVALITIVTTTLVHPLGNNGPVPFAPTAWNGLGWVLVVLLACCSVVVLQYARRKVLIARLLLGSTPFLVLLVTSIYTSSASVDWAYPQLARSEPSNFQMVPFDENERRGTENSWSEHSNFNDIDPNKWAVIKVPVRASGVADSDRWLLNALRPTLIPAKGTPIKLKWESAQEVFEGSSDESHRLSYVVLDFLLRRADYERLVASPLTLHLDFALTQARPAWSKKFGLPEGDFNVPGFGSCSSVKDQPRGIQRISGFICRFPLRPPKLTTLTAFQTKGPCSAAATSPRDPKLFVSNSFGNFDPAPASFSLSSVDETYFSKGGGYLSSDGKPLDESLIPRLCPGAPVVITQYQKVRSMQNSVTIDNFNLSNQY
jgi:hypothetical protein